MELAGGSITALVGGNGSGKTTLARMIAGYLTPYRGKMKWHRPVPDVSVAYLPANPAYLFIDAPFDGSGGEREWHGIDLVLSKEADLYILDEPTKGLDPVKKAELIDRLQKKKQQAKSILLVTHDIEFAATAADTMAMMYDGKVAACEEKERFLRENVFYTTELQRLLS